MSTTLTAGSTRVRGLIGRVSMYRLVLSSLGLLAIFSLVLSFAGLVVPEPLELVVSAVVLVAACAVTDLVAQSVLRMPRRLESSLITAAILLFVLRPSVEPLASRVSYWPGSWHPRRSTCWRGGGATSSTPRRPVRRF